MLTAEELLAVARTGDVVFTAGKGFDPIGHLLQSLMGGSDWSHACIFGSPYVKPSLEMRPKIWTTGARWGVKYGWVDAEKYLKNKRYAICRYSPYAMLDRGSIELFCEKQQGEIYPFHKVLGLALTNWINPDTPANPLTTWGHGEFCSQGVALALEAGGGELKFKEKVTDRGGIDPRTLFNAINLELIYG